ncbi:MAG TPA: HEAT repeat domain-containing protein [Candidatus Bathyarchaeia archaeon]|nr:HEAT repeat domain-containing protein [Candidatus Bathyarchaeia archaeon]
MKRYPFVLLAVWASILALAAMPAWAQDALDAAFKDVAAYKFGASRESLTVVADAVRDSQANPGQRKALVEKLVAILGSGATLEGKDFACRQLSIAGGDEAVPALAKLLTSPDTSNMARYALERIPGPAADKALVDALKGTSGLVQVGIINSLGMRHAESAVKPLGQLAKGEDAPAAEAACAALAKIANPDAVKALDAAKKPAGSPSHAAWADAWLAAADNVAARDKKEAAKMFAQLGDPAEAEQVRVAAFVGKVNALGPDALPEVLEAMKGSDLAMQRASSIFVRKLEGANATAAFAGLIGSLPADGQILLLAALSDRADPAALPAAIEAAASADVTVRTAAFAAMAKLGNASVVPVLAKAAAAGERPEQEAARLTLDTLKGADIDPAMAAAMTSADDAQKAEIARSLAARNATSAVPVLLAAAGSGSENVQKESFKALSELAAETNLPALVDLLVKTKAETPRREAEKAVAAVAKRGPDESKRAAAVLAVLGSVKDAQALASLYNTLALIGDDNGLAPLRDAVKNAKPAVKDAAVRALTSWPTPSALDDALAITKSTKNDTHRVLALRGLLRMLELKKDRPAKDSVEYLAVALKAAKSPDEKKMVIGGLANVSGPAAMKLVEPFLKNDDLKQEAALAAQKIFKGMCTASASSNSGEAADAIDSNMESRWSSGEAQKPGQWFAIDMAASYTISAVALECARNSRDYARGYQVFVSNDNQNWGNPVAEGKGEGVSIKIDIKPTAGRYLKIVQTDTAENNWSINEVKIDFK